MTPAELAVAIRRILEKMQADGSLVAAELPTEIVVEAREIASTVIGQLTPRCNYLDFLV